MIHELTSILGETEIQLISISGGDINESYLAKTPTKELFIKYNAVPFAETLFETEAKGLFQLSKAGVKVPTIIGTYLLKKGAILVMEYLQAKSASSENWIQLGRDLATLHSTSESYFGNEYDNYIGTLQQSNTKSSSWNSFFIEQRIMPLSKKCFDNGLMNNDDLKRMELLCAKIDDIVPSATSSLLHGDLWGGNKYCADSGFYFIDPSVYFGHREMDIGMTRLFGGYNQLFYEAYNEAFPLEKDWQERIPIMQLYPNLVHLALFGGGYLSSVNNILSRYL